MKIIRYLPVIAIIAGLTLIDSCKESFLEITPNGSLDENVLATYEGIDGLLIGAYSLLDGIHYVDETLTPERWAGQTSNWVYGSIRSLEANKGSDAGDQPHINAIQRYSEDPENLYLGVKWRAVYEAIARCNQAIKTTNLALTNGTITEDQSLLLIRQARALRGFYHFEAWRMWADRTTNTFVPYLDENTDWESVTNNEDIRDRIIEDLTAGTELPNNMEQVGRFNKTVSQVFLAKAYMQMYGDWTSALAELNKVVATGTNPAGQDCDLAPTYGEIFNTVNRNGIESIYTVQYSVNDGSGGDNGGYDVCLNFPYKGGGSPSGCCGFFQPTQDLVNSFRTDANGLPYLDNNYNSEKVTNDQGLGIDDPFTEYTGRLDPRLDWTVGRRGIRFWDWGEVTGTDWVRDQTNGGPYIAKKQVFLKEQQGVYTEVGGWHQGWTANGYRMIRYADVLLLKAECEAMLNTDDRGMAEVNLIRNRAANSDGWVKEEDNVTNAANYVIGLYPASQFANTDDAMTAIKFERKLELGMEGHRFFDMQRWYTAAELAKELTRILNYEKTMEWGVSAYPGVSIGPEDANYPIPQRQIDLMKGNLVQNR